MFLLNIILLNNVGKIEYDNIVETFKTKRLNLKDYKRTHKILNLSPNISATTSLILLPPISIIPNCIKAPVTTNTKPIPNKILKIKM